MGKKSPLPVAIFFAGDISQRADVFYVLPAVSIDPPILTQTCRTDISRSKSTAQQYVTPYPHDVISGSLATCTYGFLSHMAYNGFPFISSIRWVRQIGDHLLSIPWVGRSHILSTG